MDKIDTDAQANRKAIHINKILEYFAKQHQNTYFLNPYSVFCRDTICHALSVQGEPYYSDDNHLSEVGSNYLFAKLKPQLLAIIQSDFASI